jgi:hypothetical protein
VLVKVSNGGPLDLAVFQQAGLIGVGGIALAIVLSFFIRETGSAAQASKPKSLLPLKPALGGAL